MSGSERKPDQTAASPAPAGDKPQAAGVGMNRRDLLAGLAGAAAGASAGAATVATAGAQTTPAEPPAPDAAAPDPSAGSQGGHAADAAGDVLFFLNDEEARFLAAAVDRLIPPDDWPGAAEAGVVFYIDRQLASEWGAGGRMYLNGPWAPSAPPQQGYQLRHPPAELYRIGIAELRALVRDQYGDRDFADLAAPVQDEVLKGLETSAIQLPSIPGAVFFETLLANTIEGYFADPAYGGNRGMAGWRMVGFPGAYAAYLELVDQYGIAYTREPISFADTGARLAHIHAHDH